MAKLHIKSRYGIIPNEILRCKTLSLKAKGLYVYIQSKPEDWCFSSERIADESKDSRDAVRTGLIELEECGLLVREKKRTETGYWEVEYTLMDALNQDGKSVTVTRTENPTSENPTSENPTSDNPSSIVNKTIVKKSIVNKIEVNVSTETNGQEIIINDFKNSELSEKFREFEKHRKEIKEKLTPTNRAALVKKLSLLDPQEAIDQLQQSIENGWRGIFPVKSDWREKKERRESEKEFMSHIVIR